MECTGHPSDPRQPCTRRRHPGRQDGAGDNGTFSRLPAEMGEPWNVRKPASRSYDSPARGGCGIPDRPGAWQIGRALTAPTNQQFTPERSSDCKKHKHDVWPCSCACSRCWPVSRLPQPRRRIQRRKQWTARRRKHPYQNRQTRTRPRHLRIPRLFRRRVRNPRCLRMSPPREILLPSCRWQTGTTPSPHC